MKQDSLSPVEAQGECQCDNESACYGVLFHPTSALALLDSVTGVCRLFCLDNEQESRNSRTARWLNQKGTYGVPS